MNSSHFLASSQQNCQNLIVSLQFQDKRYYFKDFHQNETYHVGPWPYPVDFGMCCLIMPHALEFALPIYDKSESVAKSGKLNGLDIVLDAEQFNYAYQQEQGQGFNIALHNFSDQPMFQLSSEFINVGTNTQINIKPTVTYTASVALARFSPEDRNCYKRGEQKLNHLPLEYGYGYEMNNCLIDKAIHEVIGNCSCYPLFASGAAYRDTYKEYTSYCTGKGLYCENQIKKSLGLGKSMDHKYFNSTSGFESFGNHSFIAKIKCLPSCLVQDMTTEKSFTNYPQRNHFIRTKEFCEVASHIWQISCINGSDRKYFLDKMYPNLCSVLRKYEEFFGDNSTCKSWPNQFLKLHGKPTNLMKEMHKYGQENLAMVNIFIQNPHVTTIKRDLAMTWTSYVANTGGLLGLCLGFSGISAIEIFLWVCCCCRFALKNFKNSHF